MLFRRLVFSMFCFAAIGYVAWANMRGYVPFVANAVNATRSAPAHFHK